MAALRWCRKGAIAGMLGFARAITQGGWFCVPWVLERLKDSSRRDVGEHSTGVPSKVGLRTPPEPATHLAAHHKPLCYTLLLSRWTPAHTQSQSPDPASLLTHHMT